jgi:hypothetical protein
MKYFKDRPIGLWILTVLIILFLIYYYTRPLLWGGDASSYTLFTYSGWWTLAQWTSVILDIILVYAVTIGFYKAKNWARLYTIALMFHSAFWSIYFMFIARVWPYERYAFFVFGVITISYLMMSEVREYFGVKKLFI